MPMDEDLSVFFNDAEFADTVVVGGLTVQAIFDVESQVVLGEVVTLAPTLRMPASVAPAAANGTVCVVRGVNYSVRGPAQLQPPDGATKLLILTRV
jgi:hypothetical protein